MLNVPTRKRVPDAQISAWKIDISDWLGARGISRDDIVTGSDAWAVASAAGVLVDAYRDRDIVDAHIQTALARIFPNAVFRDAKRY